MSSDKDFALDHEFFDLITTSDIGIDLTPFKHTEYPCNDTSLPGADSFGVDTSFLFNGCSSLQHFEELLSSRLKELVLQHLNPNIKRKVQIDRTKIENRIISTRYHVGTKSVITYQLLTSTQEIKLWPLECSSIVLPPLEMGYAPSFFVKQSEIKPYHDLQETYFKKLEGYINNPANLLAASINMPKGREPFKLISYASKATRLTPMMGTFKNNRWIDPGVDAVDFRKVFSGLPVQNRVKWIGQAKLLYYLFKYLSDKGLLENTGYLWKDVASRFVDKRDKEFNPTSLRTSKNIDDRSKGTIEIEVDLL